jgi:hypothetical protein
MPSIAQIKHIASLRMPKFRQKYGQFVVEGRKAVEEVFHSGWLLEGDLGHGVFFGTICPAVSL